MNKQETNCFNVCNITKKYEEVANYSYVDRYKIDILRNRKDYYIDIPNQYINLRFSKKLFSDLDNIIGDMPNERNCAKIAKFIYKILFDEDNNACKLIRSYFRYLLSEKDNKVANFIINSYLAKNIYGPDIDITDKVISETIINSSMSEKFSLIYNSEFLKEIANHIKVDDIPDKNFVYEYLLRMVIKGIAIRMPSHADHKNKISRIIDDLFYREQNNYKATVFTNTKKTRIAPNVYPGDIVPRTLLDIHKEYLKGNYVEKDNVLELKNFMVNNKLYNIFKQKSDAEKIDMIEKYKSYIINSYNKKDIDDLGQEDDSNYCDPNGTIYVRCPFILYSSYLRLKNKVDIYRNRLFRITLMKENYSESIDILKSCDFYNFIKRTDDIFNEEKGTMKLPVKNNIYNYKVLYDIVKDMYINNYTIRTKDVYDKYLSEMLCQYTSQEDYDKNVFKKNKITYFYNFLRSRFLPIFCNSSNDNSFDVNPGLIDIYESKIKREMDIFYEKCSQLGEKLKKYVDFGFFVEDEVSTSVGHIEINDL